MPESPSNTQVVIEEPVPVVQGVPMREGEEQFAAGVNLEHNRRRESEISELRKRLEQMEASAGVQPAMRKFSNSLSARARQKVIAAEVQRLAAATKKHGDVWDGPCAPATVLNFNPVKLTLQGVLQDQSVPPAGVGKKVSLQFKGRTFTASYVTFWNAKVWEVIIGTENLEGFDAPSIKADHISPVGIAHQFYSHYVTGSIDAENMGGIVIFEGDVHTLDVKRRERNNNLIRVPIIDPELSDPAHNVYKIQNMDFDTCLEEALTKQRQYAEFQISEGHRFANSRADDIRNQLSPYHVLWHNWAVDKGYKTEKEDWATKKLSDSPTVQAVSCPGCGTRQSEKGEHFCKNCNAPFDAFKTFMAGLPVPAVWLERYEGDEWDAIVKESKRRADKRALLNTNDAEEEPRRKGKQTAKES